MEADMDMQANWSWVEEDQIEYLIKSNLLVLKHGLHLEADVFKTFVFEFSH